MKMLYTANGRYIRCCTEEGTRPVIIVCEKEYEVDVQEFMLWSILTIFTILCCLPSRGIPFFILCFFFQKIKMPLSPPAPSTLG